MLFFNNESGTTVKGSKLTDVARDFNKNVTNIDQCVHSNNRNSGNVTGSNNTIGSNNVSGYHYARPHSANGHHKYNRPGERPSYSRAERRRGQGSRRKTNTSSESSNEEEYYTASGLGSVPEEKLCPRCLARWYTAQQSSQQAASGGPPPEFPGSSLHRNRRSTSTLFESSPRTNYSPISRTSARDRPLSPTYPSSDELYESSDPCDYSDDDDTPPRARTPYTNGERGGAPSESNFYWISEATLTASPGTKM